MRKLVFDFFEFDSFDSEEFLEIHVASKTTGFLAEFADFESFVVASAGPEAPCKLSDPMMFNDQAGFSSVRQYLKRFAGIDVPQPCDWTMRVYFVDDLEWDGFFETPETYIRYHWCSSA